MDVDYYTWIFTSRIIRLALEITILRSVFSCKLLTSYSHKEENLISGGGGRGVPNKSRSVRNFSEKKQAREGTLIRNTRVTPQEKNLSG